MTETIKPVAAEWNSYATEVLPQNAPPDQLLECRRAFYAGAHAIMQLTLKTLADTKDDQAAVNFTIALQQELADFADDVETGRA